MKQKPYALDDDRWRAVSERDRAAEGIFVYAVSTTGVYCRPGCTSRRPKRENVRFFAMNSDAAKAGFRACKRCRPDQPDSTSEVIATACARLSETDEVPSLEDLAREAGLSPWHFQKTFKAAVGLTPKQFAKARRTERFRAELGNAGSVTTALYDAGFSTSSRAYDGVQNELGMTPKAMKRGARGMHIDYATQPCSLGWVCVGMSEHGVCAIELGDDADEAFGHLKRHFSNAHLSPMEEGPSSWMHAVIQMIETPAKGLDLPLDIQGTAFQRRVWAALQTVPSGQTATYSDIAERIAAPTAVRAVATACASNKLAVVIPCHRVLRKDGSLGGYRWGLDRKHAFLKRESTVE